MFANIGLTIAGLLFITVIAIISFSKKKYDKIENTIYRFILINTIVLLILEIICVYAMSHRESMPIINEILCRGYILGAIIWFIAVVGYIKCLGDTTVYDNPYQFFSQKFLMILIFFACVFFFISCMLPMKYTSGGSEQYFVIGGQAVYVLYVAFAFVGTYMLIVLFKNENKISLIMRLPVIIFLVFYFIAGVIQLTTKTDLNDLTYVFAFSVILMYFTLENQELKLLSELELAKKEAEKADKEKTAFLSSMSHEIRTPMNTIMGFSESLMIETDLNEKNVKNDIENIYTSGVNLLEIINNILDISRIESGKEDSKKEVYSLKDIVYELMSFAESKIDKEKVRFVVKVDESIPSMLIGDKLKLHKILLNLVSNATKYTKNGQITLSIKSEVRDNLAILNFNIKDTGIGIREADFDKLFEKFSKLKSDSEIQGTGLGLVITKKLVDLMGGKVTLESEYGVGTTFNITITQEISNYSKIGKILSKENLQEREMVYNDYSKYSILVVDDNELNLKVASRLLGQYKIKVTTIISGKECIELIKSNNKYDLIFLDHMMAELDGIETMRILKKLDEYNIPPVIAMTANTITESSDMYIKEGFDGYISKPIDSKELNKLLKSYFDK